MDTFCKHICPSKDRVKPAVVSNECWFTGVWICPTSASLACCPLVSQHSCHQMLLSRNVKSCWKYWFKCYHAVNGFGKWFTLLMSGSIYWLFCEFKWITIKFNSLCLLTLVWKINYVASVEKCARKDFKERRQFWKYTNWTEVKSKHAFLLAHLWGLCLYMEQWLTACHHSHALLLLSDTADGCFANASVKISIHQLKQMLTCIVIKCICPTFVH